VDSVETALIQYNATIKSLAASFGYAVVDMYQYLGTLQTSVYVDGISFNRQFIQGGCFGLDGIHPNARGYALVANQFISAINSFYGATIPPADVTKYKGVIFPTY
jgi:lysophospholipase L1-like esterase